jgi:hypothetical protein
MNTKNISFTMLTITLLMLPAAVSAAVPITENKKADKFSALSTDSGPGVDHIWRQAMGYNDVCCDVKDALEKSAKALGLQATLLYRCGKKKPIVYYPSNYTEFYSPNANPSLAAPRIAVIREALKERCAGINNLELPLRGRQALENDVKRVASNFNVPLADIQCTKKECNKCKETRRVMEEFYNSFVETMNPIF